MTADVLDEVPRGLLEQFAHSNVLAAFDYDGTLAPITARPRQASMRPNTREMLRRVSDRFPTVVISGRQRDDVDERLRGIGVFEVIGNHGIEPWAASSAYRRQARGWLAALETGLRRHPGVWIEDKRFSLAVHYRQAANVSAARAEIMQLISGLDDVRIVAGKKVYNVLPRDAPDKGAALEMARVLLGCDAAIYVGDDDTDEDVFGLRTPAPLLTIRVGDRRSSRAMFRLRNQRSVDSLLETLARLRRGSARLPWRA